MKLDTAARGLFVGPEYDWLCAKCLQPVSDTWEYEQCVSICLPIHDECNAKLTDHDRELVPFYYVQRGKYGWFEPDDECARAQATNELEHLEDGETITIERHDVPRFVAESINKLTEDNV